MATRALRSADDRRDGLALAGTRDDARATGRRDRISARRRVFLVSNLDTAPVSQDNAPAAAARRSPAAEALAAARVAARGKFLFVGERKYWVKGVTYGPFRPDADGHAFPDRAGVERDFAQMARAGFNTVRVYTRPPLWLLDSALHAGLRVIVGLAWEQHVAFLEQPDAAARIVRGVRNDVRACRQHAAILCYVVGNEIPAPIVRWHGRRAIERFVERLYGAAKDTDPQALVTYVNYPPTEYLQLPFLDVCSFNVYLESRARLEPYLDRLQNLAGERPLLVAEVGLDSRRNGADTQAESLGWQVRTAFAAGCAGAVVFSWTDEWHRGGYDIDDWQFGLTTRDRQPKPALAAVTRAFADLPFPRDTAWPAVSVVVCSYNGARTLRDTMEGLRALDYPDVETIVVDDGSTDATAQIAAEYGVNLIRTQNRGLSAARNTGWQAANGAIVAYIDDDAYPDPHWLQFLAYRFLHDDWVGVGGPNIAPAGDGPVAECVANAPGGPVHVLVSDREAEHIPGCNMAFRSKALAAIDGFDPRFRTAGDDVDVCWRLQQRGGRIGFHAGALVWHHRRNSLAMYWRQQTGYGRAEALLEEKWPERYNAAGHLSWQGRLYGRGFALPLRWQRSRIYGGVFGSAGHQSLYQPAAATLSALPLMPEWYLVVAALAGLSCVGLWLPPLRWAMPLLAVALVLPLAQAALAATRARFAERAASRREAFRRWLVTFALHMAQPLARLRGRIRHGLTPWRLRGESMLATPRPWRHAFSSSQWSAPEVWVARLEAALRERQAIVTQGDAWDAWDLAVRGGLFGAVRVNIAAEEHGGGWQHVRLRTSPRAPAALAIIVAVLPIAAFGLAQSAWMAGAAAIGAAVLLVGLALRDCGRANAAIKIAAASLEPEGSERNRAGAEAPC
ncbi:MAG: glycosyltransferase [Burkholderiales bacterium]|nr:glycosyltransferase [Burkholderiales bacterium]